MLSMPNVRCNPSLTILCLSDRDAVANFSLFTIPFSLNLCMSL